MFSRKMLYFLPIKIACFPKGEEELLVRPFCAQIIVLKRDHSSSYQDLFGRMAH